MMKPPNGANYSPSEEPKPSEDSAEREDRIKAKNPKLKARRAGLGGANVKKSFEDAADDPEVASAIGVEAAGSEMVEKVVSINRITKVTKGGKKLSFSALVVVGDTRGRVGYSLSKASEVSTAIRKAMAVAKRNMIQVPMLGKTITHEIIGACGGARVLLKPASEGTGVIAAGPVRAVCDGAGIHDILTKCHRSNNPINVVKATMDGLSRLKSKSGA